MVGRREADTHGPRPDPRAHFTEDAMSDVSKPAQAPLLKTALPGPLAKALIARDEEFTSPSYTRFYPLAVKRGRGAVIEDLDGNLFLDFTAGIAVCSTG